VIDLETEEEEDLKLAPLSLMATINQKLLLRLSDKLGVRKARIYKIIDDKVRQSHLPRDLAAIAVASEHGVGISKFATEDQLAILRGVVKSEAPPSVVVPRPAESAPRRRVSSGQRKTANLTRRRGNSVFVVHGRDRPARDALFAFLRALDLQPLEWTQAIKNTGQASPDIGTILERAFTDAAAVVVLLTPDDEARLRRMHLKSNDPGYEKNLTGQARPNVLFEAGMAFGRNPNSTVLVQLGDLRPFSDVAGKHISRLGNDATSRNEIAVKLANAGCNVNTSGTDWLDTIEFPEIRNSKRKSGRRL
jgi:predicted nucleotide-binding protein